MTSSFTTGCSLLAAKRDKPARSVSSTGRAGFSDEIRRVGTSAARHERRLLKYQVSSFVIDTEGFVGEGDLCNILTIRIRRNRA